MFAYLQQPLHFIQTQECLFYDKVFLAEIKLNMFTFSAEIGLTSSENFPPNSDLLRDAFAFSKEQSPFFMEINFYSGNRIIGLPWKRM